MLMTTKNCIKILEDIKFEVLEQKTTYHITRPDGYAACFTEGELYIFTIGVTIGLEYVRTPIPTWED